MKVQDIGEFGLIDHLAKITYSSRDQSQASWQKLLVGIGDDAAAWQVDSSTELATIDSLIQNVHFSLDSISFTELGQKALAASLSDIAAMGGVPRYALVSLTLPGSSELDDITALYEGMTEMAEKFGVAIVGGDSSRASLVTITIAVLGSLKNKHLLIRSGARVGDKVAVSGYLGGASAGEEMLRKKLKLDPEAGIYLKNAFLRPNPRIAEGQLLVESGVKTAIDISDGLISDLSHIMKASRAGARIEVDRIPFHPTVKANFHKQAIELALSGGEDYELLFTGRTEAINRVAAEAGCPVTVIGKIVADKIGEVTLVNREGKPYKPRKTGWEHFVSK